MNIDIDSQSAVSAENFGQTDSALAPNPVQDYLSTMYIMESDYYRPPLSFLGLAKLLRANPQHSRLPSLVANWVVKYMQPNNMISRETLRRAVMEYAGMGNGFFQFTRNSAGGVLGVNHLPALNTRRMKQSNQYGRLSEAQEIIPYKSGEILHVMEYDPVQSIYGVPYWIGALQSILLGEDIRLFPRRFFGNGAHAKKAIITTGLGEADRKTIDKQVQGTIKDGQFKTIMLHMSKGEVDKMIKFVDFAENASKIEYGKLASMTATDVLEAWGIPPELAGQMPDGPGSSRDLDKIERVFHSICIVPIQHLFAEALNPHLSPANQLQFDEFADPDTPSPEQKKKNEAYNNYLNWQNRQYRQQQENRTKTDD